MAGAVKKMGPYIPIVADQGLDYLAGAGAAGLSIQAKQVTQAGASPFTFTFASQGFKDMANTSYAVIVNGETAAATSVDQSTIATTGFDILGGGNTEVLHVVVIGRLKGQSA